MEVLVRKKSEQLAMEVFSKREEKVFRKRKFLSVCLPICQSSSRATPTIKNLLLLKPESARSYTVANAGCLGRRERPANQRAARLHRYSSAANLQRPVTRTA